VLPETRLLAMQNDFKAALLSPGGVPPELDAKAVARFEIYRSSVTESLVATLAAAFPTAQDVVGADYFRAAAIAFIRKFPPQRPQLSAYGVDFPGFIGGFHGAEGLPYLHDLARFEWLQVESYFADAPQNRVTGADLAAVAPDVMPQLTFAPAPSLRLFRSDFAIWAIWRGHRVAGTDLSTILLQAPSCIRIVSDGRRAIPAFLTAAEFAFVAGLAQGHAIEVAANAATSIDGDFDLATVLLGELAAGSFIKLLQP
jgi:hypothetical protein